MKLTSRSRYAVTAMLDIAIHAQLEPVALAAVSSRQGISLPYLEQLFAKLRREGLVISIRGARGGYQLANAAEQVTIGMIISAVNEPIQITNCRGVKQCQDGQPCLTHSLWQKLNDFIDCFLDDISLADLISSQEVIDITIRQNRLKSSIKLPCQEARLVS